MTKRFLYSKFLYAIVLIILSINVQNGFAQTPGVIIKGLVLESGSGMPLKQVLISVSSTGESAETDATGAFTIKVPDKQCEIIIDLPGFIQRKIFLLERDSVTISLVSTEFKSLDNSYNSPLGVPVLKDATYAVSGLSSKDLDMSKSTSFDQNLQGRISGFNIIEHSGMPGKRTWMNLRGISSIYCKNQPLLFIDGMIHDYDYTNLSLMEGFALNPMDIVDIEDISDLSLLKSGNSYLGGIASNGVININTEQKSEASTLINVSAYTGLSMVPQNQEVLNASEYRNYLNQRMTDEGNSVAQIDAIFPWLNGNSASNDYYKNNNNTDWQKEIFKTGMLQKFHMFIKGGDEIATYNISTGYLKQDGLYEETNFSRFNLRINGKVNITDKFSVIPNAKLSLADSYLPNLGFSSFKNPLLSALAKPPVMTINAREPNSGVELPFLDDVSNNDIQVSNPLAIVRDALGTNRNYNFLSSVNVLYKFSPRLQISSLTGIDFNNSRESIFLPDLGIARVDSAYNSPGDLTSEYRSTQNHTTVSYTNQSLTGHSLNISSGFKYMGNSYKNVKLIDLNTASDDFKNVGAGTGSLNYLRSSKGDDRGLLWMSFFGACDYNYLNKYFLNTNLSFDGNSATADDGRYNFYPSIGAAWRLSSEDFLSQYSWLEDLKVRVSWSRSGNIFSSIYDYSKLYYTDARFADIGVLMREAIPNEKMEIEKKNSIDAGLDLSLFRQLTNFHIDYFRNSVNNLIIAQNLQDSYGYTSYYNNSGKMVNAGIEIAADQRFQFGQFLWTIGVSFAKQTNEITALDFINPSQNSIITKVEGAEYITSVGYSVNAFYGYKTNGIFADAAEAANVIGPKGKKMQAGDVRFVDIDNILDADGNIVIDESDKTIIGNPNPDFFGGFSTLFSFKRIKLSAVFTYSMGNDAFNYIKYKAESMDSYSNQHKSVINRWTPGNTNASIPRASLGDPTGNSVFSDRWIEDASFIKLKQITMNYTLPSTRFYKGITVYITASNLLTITKYSGYDPEFMYMNNPFSLGIDYGSMPQTRSFILGLKLGL